MGAAAAYAPGAPSAAAAEAAPDRAWDKLYTEVAACGEKHGYDPEAPGVGEHEIAPTEREYRECVYASVERWMIPSSPVSQRYRDLIDKDRSWTDMVEQGEMTRAQRRELIDAALADIKALEAAEQSEAAKRIDEMDVQMERMRREREQMLRFQRMNRLSHSRAIGGLR